MKALIAAVKDAGGSAMAITDRNNMFGAYDFSKQAAQAGIQPIIGCQLPIAYGEDKEKRGYVVLLAQNETGYINICRLMSDAQEHKADRPNNALSGPKLKELNDGIILLSGSVDGLLSNMIRDRVEDKAREVADFFQKVFKDRFYMQINRSSSNQNEEDLAVEQKLLEMSRSPKFKCKKPDGSVFTGIPVVATAEVRYASKKQHDGFEILRAIDEKIRIDVDEDGVHRKDENDYHVRTKDEMIELFSDLPHALENANSIAQRCAFMVEGRDPILPAFDTAGGRTEVEELRAQAEEGLNFRLSTRDNLTAEQRKEYDDRLNYELGIIEGMGFPGYFLIVSDFIKWAKEHDIPVGPGRGSGAGSLVAWSLLITDLDPFQFGLLFERFLNPERVSMPDFDVDFCMHGREEVIAYVREKYGEQNVGQINTFGEIKSKTALKDAARALIHPQHGGFGFGEINDLTKIIPAKDGSVEPQSLSDAYKNSEELRGKIDSSTKFKTLFESSKKIEGLLKSAGAHAAGVVIGDRPLDELVPVRWDDETGMRVSQYNMKGTESVGLVKFDFLGLKTLSVIKEAIKHIKNGRGIDIDISAIPLDDQETFEMLANGTSIGVFQFESAGMQDVLKKVKPTRLEDLIAVNALYRPGPMDQIPHYADCKNGKATPHYPQPVERTKPFLEETFGIMVYQEQVMKVAQEVAGYSLGGADLLRRAMGKKIASEMDAQRKTFVSGAREKGTPRKEAEELFDTIAKFAGYGFNKSHAAAYAYIAYQTAWLKKHYQAEFYASLLTFEAIKGDQNALKRMALIREEMAQLDIEMLPPDINRSFPEFRPEASKGSKGGFGIRFGFSAIKGISGEMKAFLEERETNGFQDIRDFSVRGAKHFDKSKLEKLVEAGSFDTMDENRLRASNLIRFHASNAKGNKGQSSFFEAGLDDNVPESITSVKDWGNRQDREFNSVGFYFNTHPADHFLPKLRKKKVRPLDEHERELKETNSAQAFGIYLCAMVEGVFPKYTRFKKLFMAGQFSERSRAFSSPFFGSDEQTVEDAIDIAKAAKAARIPVILKAKIVVEDGGRLSVFGQKLIPIEEYLADIHGAISLSVDIDQILDLPETSSIRNQAFDDHKKGLITEEQHDRMIHAANVKKIQKKLVSLKGFFDAIRVPETGQETSLEDVEISIQLQQGSTIKERRKLEGKYRVTPSVESRLKAIDGVVSVAETI